MELENWITWKRMTGPDRSDAVDFRHELEHGVTDKLEVSVYLAEWFYENQREHPRFAYSDSTIELISNLTKPVACKNARASLRFAKAVRFLFRAASNATRCLRVRALRSQTGHASYMKWEGAPSSSRQSAMRF